MYRSRVKLRTNIVGELARHIRPLSKAKYVRYIPFVDTLFLTTESFLLGMTKSPRPRPSNASWEISPRVRWAEFMEDKRVQLPMVNFILPGTPIATDKSTSRSIRWRWRPSPTMFVMWHLSRGVQTLPRFPRLLSSIHPLYTSR